MGPCGGGKALYIAQRTIFCYTLPFAFCRLRLLLQFTFTLTLAFKHNYKLKSRIEYELPITTNGPDFALSLRHSLSSYSIHFLSQCAHLFPLKSPMHHGPSFTWSMHHGPQHVIQLFRQLFRRLDGKKFHIWQKFPHFPPRLCKAQSILLGL